MPEPEEDLLLIAMGSQLSNNTAKTALDLEGLIQSMLSSGMDKGAIKTVLMQDLTTGGRLFGGFRNQIKSTVRNGIGYASNKSSKTVFTEAGIEEFKWVSIGDKSVCEDCEDRHGETGSMEFFNTIGLPKSGFSICQFSCRCQLLPSDYKGEKLDEPLLKDKKEKKRKVKSKQSRVRTVKQLMIDGYTERQAQLIFRNVEEMIDMKSPDVSYILDNMDKYERVKGGRITIFRVVPKNGRIEAGDFVFDSLKGAETFRQEFGFIRGQPDIVNLTVDSSDLLKPIGKKWVSKSYGQELIYIPKSIGLK